MKEVIHIETKNYWGTAVHLIADDGKAHGQLGIEDDDTSVAYLSSLCTHHSARQKGYATRIMDEAEKEAKKRGCQWIRLWTEKNQWPKEWYKRRKYYEIDFGEPLHDSTVWLEKLLHNPWNKETSTINNI